MNLLSVSSVYSSHMALRIEFMRDYMCSLPFMTINYMSLFNLVTASYDTDNDYEYAFVMYVHEGQLTHTLLYVILNN